MKKLFVILFVMILLGGFSVMAKQKGDMAVVGGLEISLPTDSDFQNFAGTGFGVTAQFNYVYSEKITLLGTTGSNGREKTMDITAMHTAKSR